MGESDRGDGEARREHRDEQCKDANTDDEPGLHVGESYWNGVA